LLQRKCNSSFAPGVTRGVNDVEAVHLTAAQHEDVLGVGERLELILGAPRNSRRGEEAGVLGLVKRERSVHVGREGALRNRVVHSQRRR
jgi:hypothetical protein